MPHDEGLGCRFRAPEGFSPDPLTDLLRQGARDLIAQAVEAEPIAFRDAHSVQTYAGGHRRLVRHGHLPEREVQTGIGALPVKGPRVRDRAPVCGLVWLCGAPTIAVFCTTCTTAPFDTAALQKLNQSEG